ncbi:MAG: hydroxyneurosporene-O-methyltransferase [Gammaproteobacteria bacterium]|nr:MAG: SAM-dependent methyltransferase [Pseudomonadota bacterium]MBC6944076.1 SAM-dependent methyltransferase [Gammaproteobacteria bacterium]MCL4775985.1 SAM-dependent methyltransferase [Gammaproteobacteria bacterium]MCQ3934913.1 SAM-dependent methyltransferase [Gammaproteobacteria bacterium]MDL1880394.1 SAM-dependent methyltransferase [Gammaproteobacteria bacterium PRO2]
MSDSGSFDPGAETALYLQELYANALLVRCLVTVAEQGIADRLGPGPKTAAELAAGAGLHEETLYRMLRFLASFGFFAEDEAHCFHLTPHGEFLRVNVPGSVRDRLRRPWQDLLWRSYQHLPEMLRTGVTAFDQAHGRSFFDFLASNPEINTIYDRSMARLSQIENPLIAASYPFGEFPFVVDVGGGQGGLLAAVLDHHPEVHGVLYDQPQVVAAPEQLAGERYAARWEAVGGDFFRTIPPGGDLYVLKRILHGWDDDHALALLQGCREALRDGARILVIDAVMKPGNAPDPNKFMDVNMMALTGGRERTEAEFRRLFAAAGLQLQRVLPLPAPATLSLLEGGVA